MARPSHPNPGVALCQPGDTLLLYLLPQHDQDDQGDHGEDQQGQDDRDDDHLEGQGYKDNRDSSQTPPPLHSLSTQGQEVRAVQRGPPTLLPRTLTLSCSLGRDSYLGRLSQHSQGQPPRDDGVVGCYCLLKALLPWDRFIKCV